MEERTQHRTAANVPARLRFVLGDNAVDVALPGDVQLVDLLPSVLAQFGQECVEQGVDHEGWVAQRLGEKPLDEDRSPVELGLLDGETLYLRPRADELAPLDYDDLVDGLAERVRADAGQWSASCSRWMHRVGAVVAALAGLAALLVGGGAESFWPAPAVAAIVLLTCAGAVARAVGDVVMGTLLAGVGVVYAGTAGWLVVVALDPAGGLGVRLTGVAAAAVVALVLGLVAVADAALIFTGPLVFVVLLAVPVVVLAVSSTAFQQAAAIGIAVNLIVSLFLPATAFRLGGLRLPMLPTDAHEVREDIEPVPHRVVVERGAAVFGHLKALHLGYGTAQAVLLVALVRDGGTWPLALAMTCAALLFLRSRHLTGVIPRWALLVAAGSAVVAVVLRLAVDTSASHRVLAVLVPALAVATCLLVFSRYLPGRRLRPYWGRAVDILETLTAIAMLPLLLAVLDVYALVRGLSG